MKNLTLSLLVFLSLTNAFSQKLNKLNSSLNKLIVEVNNTGQLTNNKFKKSSSNFFDFSIVGLGEGTHGTSDFFKIKSQIIKNGIENHSLRLIMIEESLGNTLLLNDYVLNGQGDAKSALSFFGAWIYKVDEVLELVEYVKKYNERVTNNQKISFLGFDIQSIKGCLTKLDQVVPKSATIRATLDELLIMDKSYKLYNFWNDTTIEKVDLLIENLEKYSQDIEPRQMNLIKLNLNKTKKLWTCGGWKEFYTLRDRLMYETVIEVKNIENAQKIVLWGHNGHIMKYHSNTADLQYESLGYLLSQNKANSYYNVGFDFNKGGFKAFGVQEKKHTDFVVNEADSGSTASIFKNLKYQCFFLSLDKAFKNKEVKIFLLEQPFYRQVQATYDKSNEIETGYTARDEKANLWEYFNGWIYVNETKPSTFFK